MTDQKPPWPVCEAHVMSTDEDCEWCTKQLDGQQEVLDGMQEKVQTINRQLQGITGVPYVETQSAVPMLKVEVLLAMIFQEPKARMAYEINFANALVHQMNEVHKNLVRQQIAQGANGHPTLDLSKMRQRGA